MRDHVRGGALTETTFLILLAVYKANHGYGIMQFIERQTNGRVLLGAGTLYGAVHALAGKRWIALVDDEAAGANKKQYIITELGKQAAEKELQRMVELWTLASGIIKGEQT